MKKIMIMVLVLFILTSTVAFGEEELFIGLIEDIEGDWIKVETLFGLELEETNYYLDVSDFEKQNYPIGYLISIKYSIVKEEENRHVIVPTEIRAVEANQEVTIATEDKETLHEKYSSILDVMMIIFFTMI